MTGGPKRAVSAWSAPIKEKAPILVGQWNAQPLPPPPTPRSCRTTRFLSGYLIPASSALWTEDVDGRGKKERREGRIEGEVKRKVKGIERLRLEQVPLSGNGLARCHDQTRVCTASTVLAEEQPGKLNFGWNGRGGGGSREESLRGSRRGRRDATSTGVEKRGRG